MFQLQKSNNKYSLCEISFFLYCIYNNIPNCIIKYIWFLHLSLETNHYFCITLYADFTQKCVYENVVLFGIRKSGSCLYILGGSTTLTAEFFTATAQRNFFTLSC